MPTSTHQNNAVFRSPLKKLSDLKALSTEDTKLVAALNLLIAKGQKTIEKQVLPALAAYTLKDLFKLSEASAEIKNLCQNSENQQLWQHRFNNLHYPILAASNSTYFDKLMGSYLAHHYELYEEAGRINSREAGQLLREARLRGLDLGNNQASSSENLLVSSCSNRAAPAA